MRNLDPLFTLSRFLSKIRQMPVDEFGCLLAAKFICEAPRGSCEQNTILYEQKYNSELFFALIVTIDRVTT